MQKKLVGLTYFKQYNNWSGSKKNSKEYMNFKKQTVD